MAAIAEVLQRWDADHAGNALQPKRGRNPLKTESLYLNRCQVGTPDTLVAATWAHVSNLRRAIARVVDFGAGDRCFARYDQYGHYVGYEVDKEQIRARIFSCLKRM